MDQTYYMVLKVIFQNKNLELMIFVLFEDLETYIKNKKFDAILILGWNNLHYLKAIYYAKI